MKVALRNDGDWWEITDGAACIFDSANGWHNNGRVVDLAVQAGLNLSAESKRALEAYFNGSDEPEQSEVALSLVDTAEQYLNDQLETEGWSFGWYEGDFMLASEAWWEENGS